ncbi:MAG: hypothetical protein ACRYF0_11165 [Janthinobacterium lividum]
MKKTLLLALLLALAVLPYLVKAQINNSPAGDACPNKDYTYTYKGSTLGCNWVVKGDHTVVSKNSGAITIRWSDVPTDANSNPTSVSMDCGAAGTTPLSVFVSSISDKTPGPLTINNTAVGAQYLLPFGDNTALTLKVPLVELPQSYAASAPLYALTYDWVIPVNWKYNDGTNYVSDGSTPIG